MYRLYWAPDTGAFAPQVILEEVAADYELVVLDYDAHEETETDFLTLNPRGQIPALVLPDGKVITESAAMVLHISDAYPEAKLLPPLGSSERARVYRWLFYAVANLYESCLRINYSYRFADDATAAALVKKTGRLDFDKYWGLLEKDMQDNQSNGPYLLGDQYSVIDPYLFMLIGWHDSPRKLLERSPHLAALFNAVRQRSAVSKIWDQNTKKLAN
ncbi:MAG: glutathione S-transferase [Urechidicola sp.]|jgi:glutathione S-transferase/GST-like protein